MMYMWLLFIGRYCPCPHKLIVYTLSIFFIVFRDCASSQVNITLTSSVIAIKKACPEETVRYNCSVTGSRILAWSSDAYIGTGGIRLEFSTSDPVGQTMDSQIDPNVSAVLRNVTDDSVNIFLKSELFIVVNQSSTIICSANTGNRRSSDLNILLGMY